VEAGRVSLGGDWELDLERGTLEGHGPPVILPRVEFLLLRRLAADLGRPVATAALLDYVWGDGLGRRELYVYVHRLRARLEEDPRRPRILVGVRGYGYLLDAETKGGGGAPP
jgi:two-component system response regulator RegX3